MIFNALYIIGNGFDLYHKAPTCYGDFHKYLQENYIGLLEFFDEYFVMRCGSNALWCDFEQDLATYNWKFFYDNNNHTNWEDEGFRSSMVFGLEDDIREQTEGYISTIKDAFADWLAEVDLDSLVPKYLFRPGALFLTFNYTLLLEEVYHIDPKMILHIHGTADNRDSMIFGHGIKMDEHPERDENGDSNRTLFTDSESAAKSVHYAFHKPVVDIIKDKEQFFDKISHVTNITILGHSLNSVDRPYFEEVAFRTRNAVWNKSYHLQKERTDHLKILQSIGIRKESTKLFRL